MGIDHVPDNAELSALRRCFTRRLPRVVSVASHPRGLSLSALRYGFSVGKAADTTCRTKAFGSCHTSNHGFRCLRALECLEGRHSEQSSSLVLAACILAVVDAVFARYSTALPRSAAVESGCEARHPRKTLGVGSRRIETAFATRVEVVASSIRALHCAQRSHSKSNQPRRKADDGIDPFEMKDRQRAPSRSKGGITSRLLFDFTGERVRDHRITTVG